MKTILSVLSLFMLIIVSCETTNNQFIKRTGQIYLPDPEVKLVLTYTNEDIEVIGNIDITRSIELNSFYQYLNNQSGSIDEHYGLIFNEKSLQVDDFIFKNTENPEDMLIREIIYDVITKYPELDYILFPKIEVTKKSSTGTINGDTYQLSIRLKGKAVRIKI